MRFQNFHHLPFFANKFEAMSHVSSKTIVKLKILMKENFL